MKLLFLILAHDRPEDAAELARTLVGAASDGRALIHFDAAAPGHLFDALLGEIAHDPRIDVVRKRTACRWGGFGLVQAPLDAFAQIEAEGWAPDRVILLSGACLPCRPVAQLERFLAQRPKREFITAQDESWMVGGWRSARWRHHFLFDYRRRRWLLEASIAVQRELGLERRFPEGLEPRFGSQWWALTWDMCRRILEDTHAHPDRLRFFRSVWIPDEMFFQTYVHAFAPGRVAGFGLTHCQFTNRGKPVVHHDDHLDYVRTLPSFFVRKVSPHARVLRAGLLARAAEADDGAPPTGMDDSSEDYALKIAAQLRQAAPGQIHRPSQFLDQSDSVLARVETPYIVLVGPSAVTRTVSARLPEGPFTRLGEVFAPDEVDLGEGREDLKGLRRNETAIRDLHPALHLVRLRSRCEGVPVMLWPPGQAPRLLASVLNDPAALCVAALPFTGDPSLDQRLLTASAAAWLGQAPPDAARLSMPAEAIAREWLNRRRKPLLGPLAWLGDALLRSGPREPRLNCAVLPMPWPARVAAPARMLERRFGDAVDLCRHARRDWFPALEEAVRRTWREGLEAGEAGDGGTAALAEALAPYADVLAAAGGASVAPKPAPGTGTLSAGEAAE